MSSRRAVAGVAPRPHRTVAFIDVWKFLDSLMLFPLYVTPWPLAPRPLAFSRPRPRASRFTRFEQHLMLLLLLCDCCNHFCPTWSNHSRTLQTGSGIVSLSAGFCWPASTSSFKCPRATRLCSHKWCVCQCVRRPPIPRRVATLRDAELSL